jgi:hypothetical protein
VLQQLAQFLLALASRWRRAGGERQGQQQAKH